MIYFLGTLMYQIDGRDCVVEVTVAPAHAAGSPVPVILATDNDLLLCYETAPGGDTLALLRFMNPRAHYFGSPNDEALRGHPLYLRGLRPYGIFEVEGSSWIRSLERMNSVHPRHRSEAFQGLRHFILTFHDSCFECVARAVSETMIIPNDIDVRNKVLMQLLV